MRALVQRVSSASVHVEDELVSEIGRGLLVLLGASKSDQPADAKKLAVKVAALRVFEDSDGKMNLSLADVAGSVLCVSQFTLYADVRRGNRPSFDTAAAGPVAEPLYREFCDAIGGAGIPCERGRFGADMQVSLVNDGPVTLMLDSEILAQPRDA